MTALKSDDRADDERDDADPVASASSARARRWRARPLARHDDRTQATTMPGSPRAALRASGATSEAATAPAIHQRAARRERAAAIRKSASVETGTRAAPRGAASEYANAGIATDAAAAKSAGQRPTSMRASPYAGKTAARHHDRRSGTSPRRRRRATLSISQAGAISRRRASRSSTGRRAAPRGRSPRSSARAASTRARR